VELDLFGKCSGLRMNHDKSEAMWIGASSSFRHKLYGLKWTKEPITYLGIKIINYVNEMIKINFEERLNKIDSLLDLWSLRKLTIKGKILVVNTFIIPQLIYLCNVLDTPIWVIEKYESVVKDFIWGNKPAKVKYTSLVNTIENGGLKLTDLTCKIQALKLQWITKVLDTTLECPWKSYFSSHIKINNIEMMQCNMAQTDLPVFKDTFYKKLLLMWSQIHCSEPVTADQDCKEVIWNHSYIRINNEPIRYQIG
jgi:hypothetical protein